MSQKGINISEKMCQYTALSYSYHLLCKLSALRRTNFFFWQMRLMELCRRSSRLTGAARTELTSGRSRSSSSTSWKRPPSLSQNPRGLLGSLALQLIQVPMSPCLSGVSHPRFRPVLFWTRTAKSLLIGFKNTRYTECKK